MNWMNGSKRLSEGMLFMYMYVLTAGAAGEAAVVVEASHSLAGLAGSVHRLVALNTDSWNTTQHTTKSDMLHEDTHLNHL